MVVNASQKIRLAYLRNAIGEFPKKEKQGFAINYLLRFPTFVRLCQYTLSSSFSLTMDSQPNGPSTDWPGRYYHIDQILNTPGPRTDPAFLAGDGVDAPSRFGSFQLY